MKKNKEHKSRKRFIRIILDVFLFLGVFFLITNIYMVRKQGQKIVSCEDAKKQNADCILILGAGVWSGQPSPMLKDRLEEGIDLYKQGVAPKILVSGDHGQQEYDEVNVMKQYLIDAGISDTDIFMDHAGFSTYESMVRAQKVFQVKRMVVVSQKYHLYRALYICEKIGVDAVGENSDPRKYAGQAMRNIREMIAREKDIFSCLFQVNPKYLGETIDISGDGNVTNDK